MKNKRNRATGIVSLLVAVSLLTGCGQTESKDNVTEESSVVEIPIIFTVPARKITKSWLMHLMKPIRESIT